MQTTYPLTIEGSSQRHIYKTIHFNDGQPVIELDIHVFLPKNAATGAGVIFFHGGGWTGGTVAQFRNQAELLAEHGMVVFLPKYRLGSEHGVTPFTCLADAKSAVRWVKAHAKDFGLDSERLALGGGSAGGHLAAASSLVAGYEDSDENYEFSPAGSALCLFNPVIDTTALGYGHERLSSHAESFSPVHNVGPDAPPTIIFQGLDDTTTPPENARSFDARMKELGKDCTVHWYEGRSHGFFNVIEYDDTSQKMLAFFQDLGYAI